MCLTNVLVTTVILWVSMVYYTIFGSPGGNHECAGLHNGEM